MMCQDPKSLGCVHYSKKVFGNPCSYHPLLVSLSCSSSVKKPQARAGMLSPLHVAVQCSVMLALAPGKFSLQADTFSCAAGTAGKQKWSLILPSSARVSELTYSQSLVPDIRSLTLFRMTFFCLMAAWLNEGRCPGGRPSVSANYKTIEASGFCIEMTTVHVICNSRTIPALSQRVPLITVGVKQQIHNSVLWVQSVDCGGGSSVSRVIRARASDGTAESTHV